MDPVHKQANVEEPLGLLLSQSGLDLACLLCISFACSLKVLYTLLRGSSSFHSPAQMNSLVFKISSDCELHSDWLALVVIDMLSLSASLMMYNTKIQKSLWMKMFLCAAVRSWRSFV